MSVFNESNTIQAMLFEAAGHNGWKMTDQITDEERNYIVNDIDDQVVRVIRTFNDAFATVAGKREVRQLLRSILWVRYQIKDNEVFEKAYNYVEQYY